MWYPYLNPVSNGYTVCSSLMKQLDLALLRVWSMELT
jgi:hypothetical protein